MVLVNRPIMSLKQIDPKIYSAIKMELEREQKTINLIASENYAPKEVLEVQACVMTNKYAEGYPNRRYYGGCEFVDVAEELAIERAKKLFKAEHVNVQPHSGTQANIAVYLAALNYGDKLLGMALTHGGHLSHGHPANFSGKSYRVVTYGVSRETEMIDLDEVRKIALKEKPKMIVAGASAYSREIDFKGFGEIAEEVGAYLMADIAHIAGLVAADLHISPVPYADFVTMTTHKTMRGPRGAIVLCKKEYAKNIDKAVFPGTQGGPFMHTIAAKAVCFKVAMGQDFKKYQRNIVKNAKVLADTLLDEGFRVDGEPDEEIFKDARVWARQIARRFNKGI